MKECSKCKEVKELSDFGKAKANKDGLTGQCKVCVAAQKKIYQQEHKEVLAAYNKIHYQKHKEEISAYKKIYQQKHKEEIAAYQKEYREERKEEISAYNKIHYQKHKEERDAQMKIYQQEHKEEIAAQKKIYYEENKEELVAKAKEYREEHKEKIADYQKEWYKDNKQEISAQMKIYQPTANKRRVERQKTDPLFALSSRLRSRTYHAFKAKGYRKTTKTQETLGAEWEIVKKHIERQFTKGMNWSNNNMKGWHIDHKIPLDSATTEEELIKLCHYTNLKPEWAEYNQSKSNKIIDGTQTNLGL
tara:strand:- start:63 stop:974 length:912 start_codon:yes stop_codon:yes gene_type:complete